MFNSIKHPCAALCMAVLALMLGAPNAAFAQSPLVITNTDNVDDLDPPGVGLPPLEFLGAQSVTTANIGTTT